MVIVARPSMRKTQSEGFLSLDAGKRSANQPSMNANAMRDREECPLGQERQKSPSAMPFTLGSGKYM